jgi:hypothetical protein
MVSVTVNVMVSAHLWKRLLFVPSDKVDIVWKGIASRRIFILGFPDLLTEYYRIDGLVSGPLSQTNAYLAKVATSPESENPNYQHLICVYIPDVYDKGAVMEVMKVLLRHHGVSLSGVKSDLYTGLGIDSKHPTGLQSTVRFLPTQCDDKIANLYERYGRTLRL